jgi:hypothetical protein
MNHTMFVYRRKGYSCIDVYGLILGLHDDAGGVGAKFRCVLALACITPVIPAVYGWCMMIE